MSENQNSAAAPEKSIYHNLAKGKTVSDKLEIINSNAFYIDVLGDLIEGYDASFTTEPIEHAIGLIQELARGITINNAGITDAVNTNGDLS